MCVCCLCPVGKQTAKINFNHVCGESFNLQFLCPKYKGKIRVQVKKLVFALHYYTSSCSTTNCSTLFTELFHNRNHIISTTAIQIPDTCP